MDIIDRYSKKIPLEQKLMGKVVSTTFTQTLDFILDIVSTSELLFSPNRSLVVQGVFLVCLLLAANVYHALTSYEVFEKTTLVWPSLSLLGISIPIYGFSIFWYGMDEIHWTCDYGNYGRMERLKAAASNGESTYAGFFQWFIVFYNLRFDAVALSATMSAFMLSYTVSGRQKKATRELMTRSQVALLSFFFFFDFISNNAPFGLLYIGGMEKLGYVAIPLFLNLICLLGLCRNKIMKLSALNFWKYVLTPMFCVDNYYSAYFNHDEPFNLLYIKITLFVRFFFNVTFYWMGYSFAMDKRDVGSYEKGCLMLVGCVVYPAHIITLFLTFIYYHDELRAEHLCGVSHRHGLAQFTQFFHKDRTKWNHYIDPWRDRIPKNHGLAVMYQRLNWVRPQNTNQEIVLELFEGCPETKNVYFTNYHLKSLPVSDTKEKLEKIEELQKDDEFHPNLLGSTAHYWEKGMAKMQFIKPKKEDDEPVENPLFKKGNPAKALDAYEKINIHDPRSYTAAFNMGRLYHEEGKYAEARKHFDNAINRNEDYARAYAWIAKNLAKLGEPDQALNALDAELKILEKLGTGTLRQSDLVRVEILIDAKRYEEADLQLDKSMEGVLQVLEDKPDDRKMCKKKTEVEEWRSKLRKRRWPGTHYENKKKKFMGSIDGDMLIWYNLHETEIEWRKDGTEIMMECDGIYYATKVEKGESHVLEWTDKDVWNPIIEKKKDKGKGGKKGDKKDNDTKPKTEKPAENVPTDERPAPLTPQKDLVEDGRNAAGETPRTKSAPSEEPERAESPVFGRIRALTGKFNSFPIEENKEEKREISRRKKEDSVKRTPEIALTEIPSEASANGLSASSDVELPNITQADLPAADDAVAVAVATETKPDYVQVIE